MGRAFLTEGLLFLVPFVVFGLYLLARQRSLISGASWSGDSAWLVLAGIALVIASLIYGGLTGERHKGGFVPTHMENGRLVPGQFK